MLTERTQRAIEILHDIASYQSQSYLNGTEQARCTPDCVVLLKQLQNAGIIRLLPGRDPGSSRSYELCVELSGMSLYQLLIAIGEGINLLAPDADEERIYKHYHYGMGASRLGVVNQMVRTLLCDITMLDL